MHCINIAVMYNSQSARVPYYDHAVVGSFVSGGQPSLVLTHASARYVVVLQKYLHHAIGKTSVNNIARLMKLHNKSKQGFRSSSFLINSYVTNLFAVRLTSLNKRNLRKLFKQD